MLAVDGGDRKWVGEACDDCVSDSNHTRWPGGDGAGRSGRHTEHIALVETVRSDDWIVVVSIHVAHV